MINDLSAPTISAALIETTKLMTMPKMMTMELWRQALRNATDLNPYAFAVERRDMLLPNAARGALFLLMNGLLIKLSRLTKKRKKRMKHPTSLTMMIMRTTVPPERPAQQTETTLQDADQVRLGHAPIAGVEDPGPIKAIKADKADDLIDMAIKVYNLINAFNLTKTARTGKNLKN